MPGERILLLRRQNTGYADGSYSIPAGNLDGDEPVAAAALRVAREEIGVDLALDDIAVVGVMRRLAEDERIDFFVSATRWDGEPRNLEPTKCDDLRWFPLDALPDNVIPYVRRAIENERAGRWFDMFGWDA